MVDNFFAWLLGLSDGQLLTLILCVIVFIVIVCLVKKVIKIVLIGIAIVGCLLYFGIITPDSLRSSAEALADAVTSQKVVDLTLVSDSVKISDGVIKFKIGSDWYCIDDITRLRINSDGFYMVDVDDSEITVKDPDVQKLIDFLTKED